MATKGFIRARASHSVRVVHRPKVGRRSTVGEETPDESEELDPDGRTVLASEARVADTFLEKARGLMFRDSFPEGDGLVFPFDHPVARTVHMLLVPFPIDVLFLVRGRVERVTTLAPWIGFARARADTIIELPAGQASEVGPGDPVICEATDAED